MPSGLTDVPRSIGVEVALQALRERLAVVNEELTALVAAVGSSSEGPAVR